MEVIKMSRCQSNLVRPTNKYVLDEGLQKGKIFSVNVKEFPSIYHDSGKRDALVIKIEFIRPNGELVYVEYAPTITWSEKGRLMKMLHDLGKVPAIGAELDINSLVGMDVTATIENVERNNVVYSNIVRIQKRAASLPANSVKEEDSKMMKQLFDVDDIDFGDM